MSKYALIALAGIAGSISLAAFGGRSVRAAEEPRVETETDVVYTRAGDTDLKLDLVRPGQGAGPFPGILVIHGGGWRMGNKTQSRQFQADLARRGYVAISPQYRFCPKDRFPAQVHDVKAAVRWLKSNAAKYRVDPERIGAVGFSAGGHLSLMLGLTSEKDGLEGDAKPGEPSTKIQAVVNYFGPSELGASDIPNGVKYMVKDFLGATPEEKPELSAKASPLTYISSDDAPVLTFQGTKDTLVPWSQAVKLTDALSKAGVPGRVELLIGAGHGWRGADLDYTKAETFAFFDNYLKQASK